MFWRTYHHLISLPVFMSIKRPGDEVVWASVYQASCQFKPQQDQQPGSLKNWYDHAGCVQMTVSLGGDVKLLPLSPSLLEGG